VHPTAGGARIDLAIDTKYRKLVPADVTAQIVPPTAFGAKYVQLTSPQAGPATPIANHQVLAADHVTVEVNETFQSLMGLLNAVSPLEVNNALSALAEGLDGKGAQLGDLISEINQYLKQINPSLPTLAADIPAASSVLKNYAKLAPALLSTARNVTVTSNTLVSQQASLDAFLLSLTKVSHSTQTFLATNKPALTKSLDLLNPVTGVLARYAPELPCTLEGLVIDNSYAEPAIGGTNASINTYTVLEPGDAPYTQAQNLPQLGDDSGPNCYGLPLLSQAQGLALAPHFKTGADPYVGPQRTTLESGAQTVLGLLTGLVEAAP
jgi:virulence factor Mce-like protein